MLATLAACGGPAAAPSSLPSTGSIQLSLPAQAIEGTDLNWVGAFYAPSFDSNGDPLVLIWLSSSPKACAALGQGANLAGANLLDLRLKLRSPGGSAVTPQVARTYQLNGGATATATARILALDDGCAQSLADDEGLINQGSASILRWAGTGSPLSGALSGSSASGRPFGLTFTAAYCAALSPVGAAAPLQCQSDPSGGGGGGDGA